MSSQDIKNRERQAGNHGGVYDDGNPGWYNAGSKDKESEKINELTTENAAENKQETEENTGKSGFAPRGFDKKDTSSSADNRGKKPWYRNRKKLLVGGSLGGLVGLVVAVSTVITGPLELMYLGQILGNSSRTTDTMVRVRSGSLFRNARGSQTSQVGETRVGAIASRIFAAAEADLNRAGIRIDRASTTSGRPTNMNIDPTRNSNLNSRAAIARHFGISQSSVTPGNGGTFNIDMRNTSIRHSRALAFSALSSLEDGKIKTAMNKRVMAKYFNIPSLFRPFQRLQSSAQNRYATAALRKTAEQERKATKRAELRTKYQAARTKIQSRLSGFSRAASQAVLFTSGVCLVRSVSDVIPLVNFAEIVVPSMVGATDMQAINSQIMYGQDLDFDQLGAVKESFTDEDGNDIWQAASIKALANNGADSGGVPMDIGYKQAFMIDTTQDGILASTTDTLGDSKLAGGLCSTFGQAVQGIVGVALLFVGPGGWVTKAATAGASAVATSATLNFVTDIFVDQLTENPIDTFSGPLGGNLLAHGAKASSNLNARSMGGVELTEEESLALMDRGLELEQKEFEQKSFLARTFDPYDYRSLTASALRDINSGSGTPLDRLANFTSNPFRMVASGFTRISTNTVFAQDEQFFWGFPDYGVPLDILESPEYEDPYENAVAASDLLDLETSGGNPNDTEYIDRALHCFGVEIRKESRGMWGSFRNQETNPTEEEYLDANCGDSSDDWTRIRLFILDNSLVTIDDCYLGNSRSCGDIGIGPNASANVQEGVVGVIIGDPNAPSENVACAPGTKDLGTDTPTYTSGEEIPTRLCEIEEWIDYGGSSGLVPGSGNGVVVNSRVSGAWLALYRAAQADDIDLRVTSSFRSFERQEQLCGPSGRRGCARPGYSNHQTGHAVDFANIYSHVGGAVGSRGSCQTATGNPEWEWLVANAERFGMGQLPIEAWHWDADYSGGCQ